MCRRLMIQVGGTSAMVAFAIALALGASRPLWVMEVALLLALVPFTFLVYSPWLRGTLQLALMFAALLTGVGP